MELLYRIICLIIGYCFGLFQTGYILGRLHGVDIREYGSGNAGTTNASRVLGKNAGILVYIGDCCKALLCGIVIRVVFDYISPDMVGMLVLYSGLGVVIGHTYPFYMDFRGGKGVAATSGAVIAFGDWRVILICLAIFVSTVLISRYMSFASLCVVTSFVINTICWGQFDYVGLWTQPVAKDNLIETYILATCFAALVFYKHCENIVRLVTGTERKLGTPREEDLIVEDIKNEKN